MKALRTWLFAFAMLILTVGYAGSQYAFLTGTFKDYAAQVDTLPVQALAGLLLLAAVVMPFLKSNPDSKDEEGAKD